MSGLGWLIASGASLAFSIVGSGGRTDGIYTHMHAYTHSNFHSYTHSYTAFACRFRWSLLLSVQVGRLVGRLVGWDVERGMCNAKRIVMYLIRAQIVCCVRFVVLLSLRSRNYPQLSVLFVLSRLYIYTSSLAMMCRPRGWMCSSLPLRCVELFLAALLGPRHVLSPQVLVLRGSEYFRSLYSCIAAIDWYHVAA